MSYYDNVEFQIPLPALDDGSNSSFPAMGQFTGKGFIETGQFVEGLASARLTPPSGPSNDSRGPYNYSHIKGVVYYDVIMSQPFEIRNFHDYPYSPFLEDTIDVSNGDTSAFEDYTNLVDSNNENALIITQVKLTHITRKLIITGYTSLGIVLVNNNAIFNIKGTYLFI